MPKFRTEKGVPITQQLFVEKAAMYGNDYALYAMEPNKDKPYIVDLFVKEQDLSEYQFAIKYFESFEHWKKIREANWFEDTYRKMREALEAYLQSLAHQKMLDLVYEGKAGHQTLAYLGTKGYINKDKAGRPSKKAIEAEAEKEVKRKAKEQEELESLISHNPKLKKFVKEAK